MRLRNATTGQVLATRVRWATAWAERMAGFLSRQTVPPDEGLWFPECWVIHTVGMRVTLDIIFLDKHDRVLQTLCRVEPNRFAISCKGAHSVVELGAGALEQGDVLVGDRFSLE